MSTLAVARSLTRSYLDEATASDWTNDELDKLLNQRYLRVATMVMTTYEDYYITTATFNVTANKQEYTSSDGIPTDIFKIRRVELNYDPDNTNSSPTRCVPLANVDAVRRDLGYQNAGIGLKTFSNAWYYRFGHSSNIALGFIPIPNKTGANAGKIWYVQQIPPLTQDAQTFNIPYVERYWNLIVEGAVGDGLRFGQQDSSEADRWDAKFDRGLILLQEELEDPQAEETKMVMDVSGEYLDFVTDNG